MKKRFIIRFKRNTIDKPVVYKLAKDYDLVFNILRANVSPKADSIMVLEIEGEKENFEKGIRYLKDMGLDLEPIEQDINRDEQKCVHCGVCTSVCPPERSVYRQREHEGRLRLRELRGLRALRKGLSRIGDECILRLRDA
jgi:ferredoxin